MFDGTPNDEGECQIFDESKSGPNIESPTKGKSYIFDYQIKYRVEKTVAGYSQKALFVFNFPEENDK